MRPEIEESRQIREVSKSYSARINMSVLKNENGLFKKQNIIQILQVRNIGLVKPRCRDNFVQKEVKSTVKATRDTPPNAGDTAILNRDQQHDYATATQLCIYRYFVLNIQKNMISNVKTMTDTI